MGERSESAAAPSAPLRATEQAHVAPPGRLEPAPILPFALVNRARDRYNATVRPRAGSTRHGHLPFPRIH